MRNKRKIICLIILVVAACALDDAVVTYYRRAKARRKAERIIAVGDTYVIDGQVFLVVDSNQSTAAVGVINSRGKLFYLIDPNQPATPRLFNAGASPKMDELEPTRTELLLCYSCNDGYNFFSFIRASAVVKRQSTFTSLPFRFSAHANTSLSKRSMLPIRSAKH